MKKLYSNTLFFFLLPFINLFLGTLFSLKYNSFHLIPFIFLYFFTLINQMLENIFLRIPKQSFKLSTPFLILLEVANFLFIAFFAYQHSKLAGIMLILYTVSIHIQFLAIYYDIKIAISLIITLFKVVLLNTFAFYTQTEFIHYKFIPLFLGIFFPFYILERIKFDSKFQKNRQFIFAVISYFVGVIILWKGLGIRSLLLLLAFPTVIIFHGDIQQKKALIFLSIYSITYSILSIFAWIL